MVDRILNVNSDIFDSQTGSYLGKAEFKLPPNAEQALLNYINYNVIPQSLMLLDVEIYEPSDSYAALPPFTPRQRTSVMYGVAQDHDSKAKMPFEMHIKYETLTRGNLSSSVYHADSVQLSKLQPVGITWEQSK